MWCFCPASSVPGVPLGSHNSGASGICGFCQTESPVIHIDSSAKKGLCTGFGRAHGEEQRLRAVQQLMRRQSDIRPTIKETGFCWTVRNISIRAMLIFKYFTPFVTEKWRAYARPKFFFYKEKKINSFGKTTLIFTEWSFSGSLFSAQPFQLGSYSVSGGGCLWMCLVCLKHLLPSVLQCSQPHWSISLFCGIGNRKELCNPYSLSQVRKQPRHSDS